MNVLLDRFPNNISEYISLFNIRGFNIKYVTHLDSAGIDESAMSEAICISDFRFIKDACSANIPWVITKQQMKALSAYEGSFITLASRYSVSPCYWSSQDISEIFYLICNMWITVLRNKNIDVIFSFYIPHEPSSYSLYLVSKILKIPLIFIDPVLIAGRLKFLNCSIFNRNVLLQQSEASAETRALLEKYRADVLENYNKSRPPFMALVDRAYAYDFFGTFFRDFLVFSKVLLSDILCGLKSKNLPAGGFFKISRGSWGSRGTYFTNHLSYSFFAFKSNLSLYFKKRRFLSKCSAKLPKKYIYFPAPLEPEASNQPLAGNFKHLRIIIQMILANVEDDCFIVFKVSPAQFTDVSPSSSFIDWHPLDFYENLNSSGRVIFVHPFKSDSVELIKNSEFVCSINGTVGIESLILGKHSVTFAPMWYDSLPGSHLCSDSFDLNRAISKIKDSPNFEFSFSGLRFSSAISFETNGFILNDFHASDRVKIVDKFVSAYNLFLSLDDSMKWSL
jgi:hypothetical protein